MERLTQIINSIFSNDNSVENMRELELMIKEDDDLFSIGGDTITIRKSDSSKDSKCKIDEDLFNYRGEENALVRDSKFKIKHIQVFQMFENIFMKQQKQKYREKRKIEIGKINRIMKS